MRCVALDPLVYAQDLTQPAHEYLERAFGDSFMGVVYLARRGDDDRVKVGYSRRLLHRTQAFLRDCPSPVCYEAIIPGGQPVEKWLLRRHERRHVLLGWHEDAQALIEDAQDIARRQREHFAVMTLREATVAAIRDVDPILRDLERLYRNGATFDTIAQISGLTPAEVRARVDHARALGFDLRHRRDYSSRSS